MTRKAHLTIDIEETLAAEFAAAARSAQVSETEVLREMMQDYVERQKIANGYRQFLEAKVLQGRADMGVGNVVSAEEAERRFAERRRQVERSGDPS